MPTALTRASLIVALNLALAMTMSLLAPAEPILSDRPAYEYVGAAPFAPNCPFSIYCYRVMVPAVLHQLPIDAEVAWRGYQVLTNAAAGSVIAGVTLSIAPGLTMPLLASVMAQTSYGFTFTAYDPYTADPMVFLFAALLTWCWITNRLGLAIALSAIGIFAKETVAIVAASIALAAIIERRDGWKAWLLPAVAATTVLAAFHVISRVWLNWEIASNPAAQLDHGSWIGLWWRNNPFVERKIYMLFATFGFGWIFAAASWRIASPSFRALALGTIAPMAVLMIAQTPERALGNAFYAVIPLAVMLPARVPALASIAIILNGLLTAKAGSSAVLLPSAKWTLIPAAIAAGLVIWNARKSASS